MDKNIWIVLFYIVVFFICMAFLGPRNYYKNIGRWGFEFGLGTHLALGSRLYLGMSSFFWDLYVGSFHVQIERRIELGLD